MVLTIFLLTIFIVCFAMMWTEGMWSNALTFLCALFAAMIATNYYEPLASYADSWAPSFTYFWDFLMMWALFSLSVTVLRAITEVLSRVQVRFRKPFEPIGTGLFAFLTAWILVCFATASLHTAPLSVMSFRGAFQREMMANHFLGTAPDRIWLGYIQSRSRGALSRKDVREFDKEAEFVFKYGQRRKDLATHNAATGSARVKKR
jgi:hypothetical protein